MIDAPNSGSFVITETVVGDEVVDSELVSKDSLRKKGLISPPAPRDVPGTADSMHAANEMRKQLSTEVVGDSFFQEFAESLEDEKYLQATKEPLGKFIDLIGSDLPNILDTIYDADAWQEIFSEQSKNLFARLDQLLANAPDLATAQKAVTACIDALPDFLEVSFSEEHRAKFVADFKRNYGTVSLNKDMSVQFSPQLETFIQNVRFLQERHSETRENPLVQVVESVLLDQNLPEKTLADNKKVCHELVVALMDSQAWQDAFSAIQARLDAADSVSKAERIASDLMTLVLNAHGADTRNKNSWSPQQKAWLSQNGQALKEIFKQKIQQQLSDLRADVSAAA